MNRRIDSDSGQAAVVIIGFMFMMLAFVGLSVDGSRMFVARRDLRSFADEAALAGASEIDEGRYRASGGTEAVLDPHRARDAALYQLGLAELSLDVDVEINAEAGVIEVRLQREVPMIFLRIIGMESESIGASAKASPKTP